MDNQPKHITEAEWAKYFAGEASDEEIARIESWRDESLENADLFLEYALLWEDLGAVQQKDIGERSVDVDAAWQKLKNKKESTIPMKASFPWFKIAASLVFVVGLFYIIGQLNQEPKIILTETQNQTKDILLADGSTVKLNKNSSLEYPEKFENLRTVKLKGEAFFDIEHDLEKRFSIQIEEATVTVLGTAFNIKSSKSADTVSVYVSRGTVLFAYQDKEQILEAGEKATLFAIPSFIEKESKDPSGLDEFWRTRKLTFTGQNLDYVTKSLSQAYNQPIVLSGNQLSNCSLSASFENDSLTNILEVIALTLDLEISSQDQKIILSGEGCEPN